MSCSKWSFFSASPPATAHILDWIQLPVVQLLGRFCKCLIVDVLCFSFSVRKCFRYSLFWFVIISMSYGWFSRFKSSTSCCIPSSPPPPISDVEFWIRVRGFELETQIARHIHTPLTPKPDPSDSALIIQSSSSSRYTAGKSVSSITSKYTFAFN